MFKILGRLAYKFLNVEVRYRGNWQKDNKWLIDKKFQTIIDVGANKGQFAQKMRKFFPDATIISFEPIPQVYEELKKNFENDPLFIAHNCALGERAGTAEFFANENSESSSLLKMKDHTSHFSKAKETKAIQVNICRLDDVLNVADLKGPVMVKLDVQGYEDMVIKGGIETLKRADMVMSEVSFFSLYEGQKLFDDMYHLLASLQFSYKGNYEQLYSPANNIVLQADAIFFKNK